MPSGSSDGAVTNSSNQDQSNQSNPPFYPIQNLPSIGSVAENSGPVSPSMALRTRINSACYNNNNTNDGNIVASEIKSDASSTGKVSPRHASPHSDTAFGYRSSAYPPLRNRSIRGWSDVASNASSSSAATTAAFSRSPKSRFGGPGSSVSNGSGTRNRLVNLFRNNRQYSQKSENSLWKPGAPQHDLGATGDTNSPGNNRSTNRQHFLQHPQQNPSTNCTLPPISSSPPHGGIFYVSSSGVNSFSSSPGANPANRVSIRPNVPPSSSSETHQSSQLTRSTTANKLAPCKGRLNLAIFYSFAHITVHLIEARGLRSLSVSSCNPYIRVAVFPDNVKFERYETDVYRDSNNPHYDVKFVFEIHQADYNKRILISIWNKLESDGFSEFLGCMSFGIKSFLSKNQVSGWYYLLSDATGRKKHLRASNESYDGVIPETNRVLSNMQVVEFNIPRGSRGFGFTLAGACPVYVSQVDAKSPAEQVGLKPRDFIVKIDGVNVSRSTTESVVRMIRVCNKTVSLIICRPIDPTLTRPLPPVPHNSSMTTTCSPLSVHPQNRVFVPGSPSRQNHPLVPSSTTSTTVSSIHTNSGATGPPPSYNVVMADKLLTNMVDQRSPTLNKDSSRKIRSRSPSPSQKVVRPTQPILPENVSSNSNGHTVTNLDDNVEIEDITSRLRYLGHLKPVNFQRVLSKLEYTGSVVLIEGKSRYPVDLYLFQEVLLIGQKEPDGFITVIKEPIYNVKISYCNIPATAANEMILQYRNDTGKKQFVHFQSANIRDWLVRIQAHMLYNCNWWMNNIA